MKTPTPVFGRLGVFSSFVPIAAVATIGLATLTQVRADIAVNIDFPGGSAEIRSIDQENAVVSLDPTDHPDKGWRCWWYAELTGLPVDRPFTLEVGDAPWATPDRPTYSIDGGKTWLLGPAGERDGKRMRYLMELGREEALVAWGPPFVPSDAKKLVDRVAESSFRIDSFSLCETREGNPTPAIRSYPPTPDATTPLVWLHARQHAWESGASWVAQGFADWLISDDPAAARLRDTAEVVLVPIMDIDNVARGAGGKNQLPQDHNRDWTDQPHWRGVAAAQKELKAAADDGRLAVFIDLHNPGPSDRFPYFYVPPATSLTPPARQNLSDFLVIAKQEMTGPLRFMGRAAVSGEKYDPKAWKSISKNWVAHLGTPAISVTLETAWNTPSSHTEGYQTVGRQLGKAIVRYLEE